MASRTSNPSAAAFEATERNAATSAVVPSNTSGAQKWNGTADKLERHAHHQHQPAERKTVD